MNANMAKRGIWPLRECSSLVQSGWVKLGVRLRIETPPEST